MKKEYFSPQFEDVILVGSLTDVPEVGDSNGDKVDGFEEE